MKKTRLTEEVIPEIVRLLKLRISWKHIADAIGVNERTLHYWRSKGETDRKNYKTGRRTMHHDLVIAIEQARSELIQGYAEVVRNEALVGKTTKTTRIIKLKDGSTTQEVVTKTEPPNAVLAHKILQQVDPANWAEIKRIEIDWQKKVSEQGSDPEELKEKITAHIVGATDESDDE